MTKPAWATTGVGVFSVSGPDISYANATVTPGTLPAGSAVTATVTVENTGGSQQAYNATLAVDGTVVDYETGMLNAGENTTVTFTKTLWAVGDRDVAVGGLAAQTVTVEAANAKFHGGPGNPGYYPKQSGPTSTPVEAWNITDGTPQVMQPTIVGDTLYTAFHDGGNLHALDPETGAEKWNWTPGGTSGSTWTTPAYANGVLYLGSNDYKLHALNATDGSELWNYSTQTNVRSAPAVVDGVVYFGSNDGNVTALNATTGEELWYYTMYQPVLVESNPAVVDGVVYVAADDDNVTALNAMTGEKIWNFTLIDQSQSDPTVADGTVFVGSDSTMGETSGDGRVYALNATDGTERWNHTMSGDVDSSQVYADGVVYAASRGGDLVALNATDGSEVWNATGNDFRGAPVVAGGVLYISDFGSSTVYAFNATDGTEIWAYDSPVTTLYPTPLAWDGYLYYGSGSYFHALEQPAPSISNVNATNPSGQDVRVTFETDKQLAAISVSVSGPESATLTESDFGETDNGDGSYTYTATHAGSSDGTYTATVDTAEDSDGNDGAGGESDSVLVDTTAPTISEYNVSNPDGRNVTVTFESDEQLASVQASVSGAETATLETADFTESGSGPYTYTTTYAGSSDGNYTVALASANDTAGNDGAGGESDSVVADVTPPTISEYNVSNPDGRNVTVSFESNEQLASVQASVSGAETATLGTANFTESGTGPYTYTATHVGTTNGNYTVTLDAAADSGGKDGATGQNATVAVAVRSNSGGNGGSSGGGGGGGSDGRPPAAGGDSDDDREETRVNVESRSDDGGNVSSNVAVENATADAPVDIRFEDGVAVNVSASNRTDGDDADESDGPTNETADRNATVRPAASNISVANMRMNVSRSGSFSLNVTTREVATATAGSGDADGRENDGDENASQSSGARRSQTTASMSAADREFLRATGARPAGYVTVHHPDLSDDDIRDVTFTFRVNRGYLDSTGIAAESVALYRDETVRWRSLPTTVVRETDDHYVFDAVSPGLSEFTIGATTATFEVTTAELSAETVAVGEDATVDVTLANLGGTDGEYTLELRGDGGVLASETVAVGARDEAVVALAAAFDAAGTYELTVDGEPVGELQVEAVESAADPTTVADSDADANADDGASAPTVAVVFAVLVVAAAIAVVVYRRRDD